MMKEKIELYTAALIMAAWVMYSVLHLFRFL